MERDLPDGLHLSAKHNLQINQINSTEDIMSSDDYAVIVQGLDKLDFLELEREITPTTLELKVVDEDEQKYGEPATIIAIAVIGNLVLPPLLAWLARHRRGITVTQNEDVELPDGTKLRRALTVTATESGPPSPETLDALAKMQRVPLKTLQDLFADAHS